MELPLLNLFQKLDVRLTLSSNKSNITCKGQKKQNVENRLLLPYQNTGYMLSKNITSPLTYPYNSIQFEAKTIMEIKV
jgi:hypothetical protein